MSKIHVGDVLIRPLHNKLDLSKLEDYVITATYVNEGEVTGVTANGDIVTCSSSELSPYLSYTDLLRAFTKKGCELCARAEAG